MICRYISENSKFVLYAGKSGFAPSFFRKKGKTLISAFQAKAHVVSTLGCSHFPAYRWLTKHFMTKGDDSMNNESYTKSCLNRRGVTLVGTVAFYLIAASAFAARGPHVPSIDWQPCGVEYPTAECATVQVPLDYDRRCGRQIELALARIPASNPGDKIGSLFFNPGGPGESGVKILLNGSGDFISQATGGRFDVVGFDPRGVGASTPIRCFESQAEFNEFFEGSPLFPYREEQNWPVFVRFNEYTEKCLENNWEIARHMSTADVARDLDLLRRAVGDRQLNYLGFSYGSYLGITYANLFPGNIRTMVIDGAIDPVLWTMGLHVALVRTGAAEVWGEFARLCDEAGPEICPATGPAGTQVLWEALTEALSEEPFEFPDGSVYAYDNLIADIFRTLYVPEVWWIAAIFLDHLADGVLNEDIASAEIARQLRLELVSIVNGHALPGDEYDNFFDALSGNNCGDAQFPYFFPAFRAVGEFAAQGSIFGPNWWWHSAPCASWPTAADRYIGPWKTRTANPVLVVGNYYDPATPYDGAVRSSELLTNSRLLSYAGWGHTAFSHNECARNYSLQYLLDGSLPEEGTVCPANPNPFLPVAARSQDGNPSPETLPMFGLPPRMRTLHNGVRRGEY
jgi:pimeloyl-ACP methyl ester carboxylesterase